MVLTYGYAKLPGKLKGVKRVALIGHNNYLQPIIDIFSESQAFYTIDKFEYDGDESKMSREDNIKRFKNYFEQVVSISEMLGQGFRSHWANYFASHWGTFRLQ
ncbi:hypothetical protein ACR78L_14920 [Sphingobacterium multivorum]|uniref:hypothetical protein n=1 Tax=Sphingobacterium multivorum TaxID=28454 RepID=UPI003DA5ED50